jgi:hypothetical protein
VKKKQPPPPPDDDEGEYDDSKCFPRYITKLREILIIYPTNCSVFMRNISIEKLSNVHGGLSIHL